MSMLKMGLGNFLNLIGIHVIENEWDCVFWYNLSWTWIYFWPNIDQMIFIWVIYSLGFHILRVISSQFFKLCNNIPVVLFKKLFHKFANIRCFLKNFWKITNQLWFWFQVTSRLKHWGFVSECWLAKGANAYFKSRKGFKPRPATYRTSTVPTGLP